VNKQKVLTELQRAYVATMMEVVGRGLVSTSFVDEEVRKEISGLPVGFHFQMIVLPNGSRFTAKVIAGGHLELVPDFQGKPDLSVKFKHLSHAFLVLSFQEGTARAFANDRMVADGEVSHAIRMVRCLDRMEAIILPKMVAKMAVKRYPEHLSLNEKVNKAARIYGLVAKNFLNRS
jgi:hypothetical protein